jgi:hypothetical protein
MAGPDIRQAEIPNGGQPMEKTIIKTDQAPSAVGPYSQGVVLDG